MLRLECPCGLIIWSDISRCPSCGRSAEGMPTTNKEFGSERDPAVSEEDDDEEVDWDEIGCGICGGPCEYTEDDD